MNIRTLLPQKAVNYLKHLPNAVLASVYYGLPSKKLKMIGVTGTDGKTTTVNLIYKILSAAGLKVAMISTVSARIGGQDLDTGFHVTSPDPWALQKLLKSMVKQKVEYVVLEVTSHGLDQKRVWGIAYEVGVVTNVTHEHLDYHKTYEAYLKAKAKLFNNSKVAVLNKDDSSYKYLESYIHKLGKRKIISYGIKNNADFTNKNFHFESSLPGEYNKYNCLAAIAVAKTLGIQDDKIKKSVAEFEGVTGRMEEIKNSFGFTTIVDFAHTPNALEQVLRTLKLGLSQKARLIVVFGAAGLRDKEKRPLMGRVAGRLADISVITAEDPRTEDLNQIIDQIVKGFIEVKGIEGKTFYRVPDREKAINFAIQKLANKGDTVVVCGKGHEKSMCFGTQEYAWSDQETVKKALTERRD